MALRKSCHSLRSLIDVIKPDMRFTVIKLEICSQNVKLKMLSTRGNFWIHIKYKNVEKGCTVLLYYNGNLYETLLENEHFMSVFCVDFGTILYFQKSIIEKFKVRLDHHPNYSNEWDSELNIISDPFLVWFSSLLKSRSQQLKVKKIEFEIRAPAEIMSILPFIDSKSIETIWITSDKETWNGFKKDKLDITEIVGLDHWKNAKEVDIDHFLLPVSSHHFEHFVKANFFLNNSNQIIVSLVITLR
ncbi:hypothetical protein CRE_12949 [Caenorhabditis remanei]|uniref:DUF38 domain-containing protein n=1 Tax=Caenorhabditis remanei TaxID=31234 RepID=E3N177_CAERE|nr:hypothetical protein CRE_12949 [Caenorhabditis remanei]